MIETREIDTIRSVESEAGVIASLIQNPDLSFYSENLLPNHFSDQINRCVYVAICELAKRGIKNVDAYNILEVLNSSEATRRMADELYVDQLNELVEISPTIARYSVEEYQMLVKNILDAAFRKEMYNKLRECEALCIDAPKEDIEQKIYDAIDRIMTEYSTTEGIPPYKDVVDECWEQVISRQQDGYAGIPFKFPTLNEYATIEKGELFIFAAEAKQGKSMMLLNCAVDLLKRDLAVLYLDSELNTRLFTARLVSHLTGIEYRRVTTGNYSHEEEQKISDAIAWIKTRKFTHIYIPMFDQRSIYTAVKKVLHTQGLDVLIVDYFKGSGDGDAFDSYQELGRFVDMLPVFTLNSFNCWDALRAARLQRADEIGRCANAQKQRRLGNQQRSCEKRNVQRPSKWSRDKRPEKVSAEMRRYGLISRETASGKSRVRE